jgi:hypothetical protein
MNRRRIATALWTVLLSAASGWAYASPPPSPPISGVVRHLESPVSGVLVIFYNLADSSLNRARTAEDGTFVLASAPVGVYDLIAYKRGFEPALQRLWHQASAEQLSAVSIALTKKGGNAPANAPPPTTIWDLRDRLPSDVLRELAIEESADGATTPKERVELNRILAGELKTITDVGAQSPAGSLSRAELGLHGGLPNGWHYGISGDYSRLGDSDVPGETTTGNAAGLALDVNPSDAENVRLATRRNTLSFGDEPARLQSHSVSWSRGAEEGRAESVGARYIEEINLYRATALGTSIFPIASRTWELNANYNRPATDTPGVAVGMVYRQKQAAVGPSIVGAQGAYGESTPDADLSAAASFRLGERVEVVPGVVGRYLGSTAYGIAPAATLRYDLGPATLYVRGLYRVVESTPGEPTIMPRVGSIEDNQDPASTQAYAVGLERKVGRDTSLQIEASQQKMGELVRAFFEGDFLTDFDSVYLLDGNTVRQYRAAIQQRLSDTLASSISVRYGSIDGSVTPEGAASYGITGNAGKFWSARASIEILPTHTGVAVLVHGIRQNLETPAAIVANDADKLALSVAQDLSVIGLTPLGADWKLLLALERARGTTIDHKDDPATANRLMGGVAVSF